MVITEAISAAFELHRAWKQGFSSRFHGFLGLSDCLVLGLILKIRRLSTVVCGNESFAQALGDTFSQLPAFKHIAIVRDLPPDTGVLVLAHLSEHRFLTSLDTIAGSRPLVLLVDVGPSVSIADVNHLDMGWALELLSQRAPALWQSKLAWYVHPDTREACEGLITDLCLALNDQWLDPLMLFDKVIELEKRLKKTGSRASAITGTLDDKQTIAELEERIASLESVGLIRHELLVAKAAQRRKFNR